MLTFWKQKHLLLMFEWIFIVYFRISHDSFSCFFLFANIQPEWTRSVNCDEWKNSNVNSENRFVCTLSLPSVCKCWINGLKHSTKLHLFACIAQCNRKSRNSIVVFVFEFFTWTNVMKKNKNSVWIKMNNEHN